jgi:hypothetical protein
VLDENYKVLLAVVKYGHAQMLYGEGMVALARES